MNNETRRLIQGIRALLDRITNESADASDYVLFGELSMWWALEGKQKADSVRFKSSPQRGPDHG